jgi:phytoene dehydrogenase-like protein
MKIAVVGGGTSGLLSALALEKEGHDVVVLEKSEIGGLCRSEKINGYTMDIGVHAITMLNNGPLIRLLNKYARFIPNFKEYGDYYVREGSELCKIPVSMQEWMTTPLIPHKDKILITTKIMDLMTTGFTKDTSVYDVVSEMGLSDVSIMFFDTICYFLSGEDMRNTPLWRLFTGAGYIPEDDILPFIYRDLKINPMKSILVKKFSPEKVKKVLSDGFLTTIKNSSKKYLNKFVNRNRYWTQGYPIGGVQSICDCILHSLNNTAIKNEEVVSIEEEKDGYVVGTKENNYYADVVVYSAPSRYLPDIAKVDEIQKLKDKLKNIKFTKSLTVWIGYDKNLFPYLGSEVWIDPPCWATCVTNYDKSLAPKGKHLMGFSFVNIKKKHALSAIENKLDIDVDKADIIYIQEAIPEQASCCIGQFFVYPKIKDNFYVVGTDADPRSMGITRAAYSVEVMLSEFKGVFKNKN